MTTEIVENINCLFFSLKKRRPERIEKLPQSGSERIYFRVYSKGETFIATYNLNLKENETFLYFTDHFISKGLPVPEIFALNEDKSIYLQQDLGNTSLLDKLEQLGHTEEVFGLFKKSLKQLARMHILGDEQLNYDHCLTAKEFGRQAIFSDLLYFKYYFLDTLKLPYDKQAMLNDFELLSIYLSETSHKYFMFRDFQSRNILVDEQNEVHFIDYQGGMAGALQYDVASLLWQARAELSEEWKNSLLNYYMDQLDPLLKEPVDKELFINQYKGYVLVRLLQVLGAYGFRGLFERKAHFLSSIPLALKNLQIFFQTNSLSIAAPEFERVLKIMLQEEMIARFQSPQANEQTKLVVQVNSFSYKKNIPADESGNGGGFVFDCRGILNPGRFEAYKYLSGNDKPVIDFLEQQTRMNEFLNSVFDIVDISIDDYLKRGFGHLMINFGCTGGQHRSVYAASQAARHLRNKYKVKVQLKHLNEENWVNTIDNL